jgi:hypothetical protein
MRSFVLWALGIVLCVVLYLVVIRPHTGSLKSQGHVLATDRETTHTTAPHKSTEPTPVLSGDLHQANQIGSDSAGHIKPPPHNESSNQVAELPATIEEALAANTALVKDLACRDEQAKFDMDHQLRLIAGVRDCVAGRTKSTGRISFMLHFLNDPTTRRAVGTTMDPLSSDLAPEDDKIVLECIKAFHVGSLLLNSEKYGKGTEVHRSSNINLPLEDSYIYKMVHDGSYTAGTEFGCEVP